MLMQILTQTPNWVFALFAGLLYLGYKQMLPRRLGQNRATVLPLAMTALSLVGVVSAIGDSPMALLAWLCGSVVAFVLNFQIPSAPQVRYDAESRSFALPGSMVPMAHFMGLFFTKYAVGVSMGMQPALAHNTNFAMAVGALYGAFSGVFLSRAAKLWRITITPQITHY